MAEDSGGTIETFFSHLSVQDWDALGTVLAPAVERIGPFGDRVVGRERYVDLLRGLVPRDYANHVHLVTYAGDGRTAFARVTEHLRFPDRELHLEEVYAFALDEAGLVSRVEVYWQTPEADPGGFGSAASEESYASTQEAR